jgi:hypothetical protein
MIHLCLMCFILTLVNPDANIVYAYVSQWQFVTFTQGQTAR